MASEKPKGRAKRKKASSTPATGVSALLKPPRKKAPTFQQTVGDIREIFLEQASLWKDQAERLSQASQTSGAAGNSSLAQHEPWSSLVDAKGRSATAFGEYKADTSDDESLKQVQEISKKLKRTKQWRYERPTEEEETSEAVDEETSEAVGDEDGSEVE